MSKKYNRIFDEKQETEVVETSVSETSEEVKETEPFDNKYKGPWRASRKVNFRKGPSKNDGVIEVINPGASVKCEGYYSTDETGAIWLKVSRKNVRGENATGYIMLEYLVRR